MSVTSFKNNKLVTIALPILLGGAIYILFRKPNILLFAFFDKIGLRQTIEKLHISNNLPEWFLYNLPDGLWLFAFGNLMCLINPNHKKTVLVFVFAMSVLLEIYQSYFNTFGTFDWNDLIAYSLVFAVLYRLHSS